MQDVVSTDKSEGILHALDIYHMYMVEGLSDELDALLEPDYSLTHITGYVQPRLEWLAAIRCRGFDYHRIELMQDSLSVAINGNAATVTGKGIFHATIQGLKAPWRLAFTIQYSGHDGNWLVANARYTSY